MVPTIDPCIVRVAMTRWTFEIMPGAGIWHGAVDGNHQLLHMLNAMLQRHSVQSRFRDGSHLVCMLVRVRVADGVDMP